MRGLDGRRSGEEDLNFYANMGFGMLCSENERDDDDDWDHKCGYE